jgi:hypothetical protein
MADGIRAARAFVVDALTASPSIQLANVTAPNCHTERSRQPVLNPSEESSRSEAEASTPQQSPPPPGVAAARAPRP